MFIILSKRYKIINCNNLLLLKFLYSEQNKFTCFTTKLARLLVTLLSIRERFPEDRIYYNTLVVWSDISGGSNVGIWGCLPQEYNVRILTLINVSKWGKEQLWRLNLWITQIPGFGFWKYDLISCHRTVRKSLSTPRLCIDVHYRLHTYKHQYTLSDLEQARSLLNTNSTKKNPTNLAIHFLASKSSKQPEPRPCPNRSGWECQAGRRSY